MDDAVADVQRNMTPAQKLQLVFAANRAMRLRIEGALRTWHPDWSDEQISREVARKMTRGPS